MPLSFIMAEDENLAMAFISCLSYGFSFLRGRKEPGEGKHPGKSQ